MPKPLLDLYDLNVVITHVSCGMCVFQESLLRRAWHTTRTAL